jgi:hypothetical protein
MIRSRRSSITLMAASMRTTPPRQHVICLARMRIRPEQSARTGGVAGAGTLIFAPFPLVAILYWILTLFR